MNLVYDGEDMESVRFNDDLLENIELISKILDQMKSKHLENKEKKSKKKFENNMTFKNFVTGPSNQLAYNAALKITKIISANEKYHELFIHGESGIGKTHLLTIRPIRLMF